MTKAQFNYINSIIEYAVWPSFNVDVAIFIACQFALESDFGRSFLARTRFNHCGMKRPFRRITYCNSDYSDIAHYDSVFAHYDSIEDCVLDYICWLSYQHFTQDEMHNLPSFIQHLSNSGYCPEKDYIDRIQSIYQQFKNYKNE